MYNKNKVAVGIVAYNEEEAIGKVVGDFKKQHSVDKIIVIDNNSNDRTNEFAKKAGAIVVKEEKQGYGNACQRALKECHNTGADMIILVEGDDSFEARDVNKLLAYLEDADMVVGTRTNIALIREGAKMGTFLRLGNLFIAKLLQLRFWGDVKLTDVGCTFRAVRRAAYEQIMNDFSVGSSHFSPEMMIITLKYRLHVIEIPINYKRRIGESKITSSFSRSFKLGMRMIGLIATR
ncbi:MAG: glycosyltransferase family 2 protein [Candidatus Aenigmatarchaeota archaeon]